jgi:hypothetical protein
VRERFQQIRLAFERTREVDPRLVIWLAVSGALGLLLPVLVGFLLGRPLLGLFFGLLLGPLVAMNVFSRRVSRAQFDMLEGRPGAAVVVLQSMRGAWHAQPMIAFNRKQDVVHRVVGRPGVVIVGEGSPARVKPLVKKEAAKMRRMLGDETGVHEVIVGDPDHEDSVDIRKLRMHLMKLPRSLKKRQVADLHTKLSALKDQRPPMPKGPMPRGKVPRKMR